jgi:hypothetical protein
VSKISDGDAGDSDNAAARRSGRAVESFEKREIGISKWLLHSVGGIDQLGACLTPLAA